MQDHTEVHGLTQLRGKFFRDANFQTSKIVMILMDEMITFISIVQSDGYTLQHGKWLKIQLLFSFPTVSQNTSSTDTSTNN